MLEPKTRNVEAEMLMEQLFRLTELEVRVPLNLNVLDPAGVPRVMSLKEALQAFLDHRREWCCSGAAATASPRSPAAWRSCAARSSSTSISTR